MKKTGLSVAFALVFLLNTFSQPSSRSDNRIQPWSKNPRFWQYNGKPVMLLGASSDDNLFQWPAAMLVPHLDSMKAIGANYVRNTMSDRVDRGIEIYPYKRLENGKYDLNQWNDEYWQRFAFFLEETKKRDIIVQIEVWDRFDHSREHWLPHPYNPANNVNYSYEASGFSPAYPDHPGQNKQPFFFTTPAQRNNQVLLPFQQRFVEKMLSYSLKYDHVLYCMDNETSGEEAWAVYWAGFIKEKADKSGTKVYLTEMWDNWNLTSEHHRRTFDHPERFAFCDISQNNQQKGQVHWDNFQWVREYIAASPRPLNTVKTYGADGGSHGSTKDALERWWRHVIGGVASARFHRPTSGLGLSELSAASVKAARAVEKLAKFWELQPGNDLLTDRQDNEAYLTCQPGEAYIVFFTNGGEVGLDLSKTKGNFRLKWMNIREGGWKTESRISGGRVIPLEPPGSLEWLAVLIKE